MVRDTQTLRPWRGRDHHRGGPPMLPSPQALTEPLAYVLFT